MNLLLNPDVVALNPPTLAQDLIALTKRLGNDRISIAATDVLKVREKIDELWSKSRKGHKSSGTRELSGWKQFFGNHFQVSKHKFASSLWLIDSPHGASQCRADGLAAASQLSSISVGAKNTAYGNSPGFVLKHSLNPAQGFKSALMVSDGSHLSCCDVQRWLFVKHFNDYWSNPSAIGVRFVDSQVCKHCLHGNEPPCADSQWTNARWVATTGSGGVPAQFRPGIRVGDEKYARLAKHVLEAAYGNLHFTQDQQDKYVVDTGVYVGASKGKPTKNVEIYITPRNEIHIRPSEHQSCAQKSFHFPLDK